MLKKQNQAGFTIVELMIATAVFSIVLLIVMAGVISFSNHYTKGIVYSNTQATARAIVDEVSQGLQFGAGVASPLSGGGYCVNGVPYYAALGKELEPGSSGSTTVTPRGLLTGSGACPAGAVDISMTKPTLANVRELLGKNMRLASMTITQNGTVYTVEARVVYGDDDLLCAPKEAPTPADARSCSSGVSMGTLNLNDATTFQAPDLQCKAEAGNQFCSVSDLTTAVVPRLQ